MGCAAALCGVHQRAAHATGSHERIAVVELFGHNSGETALIAAYLADVDRAIISEVPFDIERLATLLSADKRRNPSNYAMVVISEGAAALEGLLADRGVQNIEALNVILRRGAQPWWTVYGGREQIEVVEPRVPS